MAICLFNRKGEADLFEKLAEKLIDLGHDAGITFVQDNIKDALSKKRYVDAVSTYLERQKKYNGLTSIAEEYDFGGLMDYFKDGLIEKVKIAISGTEKERSAARRDLYNAAYSAANAKTKQSKDAVYYLISSSIEILRSIAKEKIPFEDKIMAAEIEDTVNEHTTTEITTATKQIETKIEQTSQFSVNRLLELKKADDPAGIEFLSQVFNDAVSKTHRFFPYYKAIPSEQYSGQLISIPTNDEALSKYPPKFVCKGTARMGNKILTNITPEDIDYADRHQIPITLTVLEAKKFLGEFEDPYQHEAESMLGRELVRQPKEFAPAQPYSIKIDDEILYDFIELGLVEILDDGVLVITNDKQDNRPIGVRLELNLETHKVEVNIKILDKSNRNELKFVRLMKAAMDSADISFYSLKLEADLVRGLFNNCNYKCGFENIEEEIDFLERICDMEEYFERPVNLPDVITEKEFNTVKYLSEMIRGEMVEREGNQFKSHGIVDADFRQRIAEMEDKASDYAFVGKGGITFLGDTFEFPLLRTIKNARINKLENVKKMAELMENGDEIPITIVSDDKCYYDQFAPEDLINQSIQVLNKDG